MVTLRTVTPLDGQTLESIGYHWHADAEGSATYVDNALVEVSRAEADALYEAGNTLYDMIVEAAEHVIENDRFFELGIPFNLIDTIKKSWENDVHWHIVGRFDLAGGIGGEPIKLLGFRADTPSDIFETAIVQWEMLRHNGMDTNMQFNALYDGLVANFKRLITLFDDPDTFAEHYDGWRILFSAAGGTGDEATAKLLQQIATDAGFETDFAFLPDVRFNDEGIFSGDDEPFEYWFKRFPWEEIATDESELAMLLSSIMGHQKAIILNPAYTMLFESKGMLKILNELYPDSPYLLETSDEPLPGQHVERRMFNKEGANTKVFDAHGTLLASTDGPYENYKALYQAYTDLPQDTQGNVYRTELFFAYESCALGFRQGGMITDGKSRFIGHTLI
jgi:glutathionylspermidine synthase